MLAQSELKFTLVIKMNLLVAQLVDLRNIKVMVDYLCVVQHNSYGLDV